LLQLRKYDEDYLKGLKNRLSGLNINNIQYNTTIENFGLNSVHNSINPNKRNARLHNYSNIPFLKIDLNKLTTI